MLKLYKFCVLFILILINPYGEALEVANPTVKYSYVSFLSVSKDKDFSPISIGAKLSIPIQVEHAKVVIVVHGSGGVDERGSLYSQALNRMGIATLEIDMWAARGLSGGLSRPKHVRETLPDVYGSIKYLKNRSDLNTDNIGLIGFSWGGVIAMLLANDSNYLSENLTALIANYPICWAYNKVLGYNFETVSSDKKLLIISASEDKYDDQEDCRKLIEKLPINNQSRVEYIQLSGATHAFELPRPNSIFFDPYAFRGKGGQVPIRYNRKATQVSVLEAGDFMNRQLNLQ